ncbi:MAG: DUF1700 domain-containing protein [Clostridiales Family XIII bacterium]|jgi:uncharacterized membrane protein|nr:DUF1700 domain-containing protein [Clostridiales Family XIII bacterium]
MNSKEYIKQLEKLLGKIPEEERRDAVAYYREYFDEAGPENEAAVMERLGSPAQIAAGIKADIAMHALDSGEVKMRGGISAVWFAVLGIFAIPIGLPVAVSGCVLVFTLLVSVLVVFVSFFAVAIALCAFGLGSIVCGFLIVPDGLPSAIFYVGMGLASAALGLMTNIAVYKLLKGTLQGIARRFNRIRYGRTVRTDATRKKNGRGNGMADARDGSEAPIAASGSGRNDDRIEREKNQRKGKKDE